MLALGVRFDDRVTGKVSEFARGGDDRPRRHRSRRRSTRSSGRTWPIVSDVKYALGELNKVVESPAEDIEPWLQHASQAWKNADPFHYDREVSTGSCRSRRFTNCGSSHSDRDAIITTGVGQHQMWSAQFYKFRRPRTWITSAGLGTMGFGLPAAMGAKVANPDKLVVDIDGDGSLLMNVQEMATCFCEKIPVKVMLLNNMHLGMVVQWEDRFHAANRAHTYLGPIDHPEARGHGNGIGPEHRYPNFMGIAAGFGWQAGQVARREDLTAALTAMIEAKGPYLLDVQVPYQEHVLPMIPAGMTVKDLIRE